MTMETEHTPGSELRTMNPSQEGGTLGDYHIQRRLGASVLGVTYLAEHRFLRRHFVLKTISPHFTDRPGFLPRFERYVAALAQLDHPHLVKIHNVSQADGHYFLVSDAILDERGVSIHLGQYLHGLGKRLDEPILYEILLQIAEALDYAHGLDLQGVTPIHRGLKPSNVVVRQGLGHPEVFLTDFGLSNAVGTVQALTHQYGTVLASVAQAEDEAALNGEEGAYLDTSWHEAILETLAFLSPEQRRAEGVKVTPATDAYAFGVLAYLAIVGELPEGAFAMPSQRVPEYHLNWDSLLVSCLQADAAKRPASLVTAIKTVQTAAPVRSPAVAEPLYFQGDAGGRVVDARQPSLRSSGPRIERPEIDLNPEKAFQIDTTVKVYQPILKNVSEIEPLLTEMITIPGGTYWRGSNDGKRDEMPRHRIFLRSFALDAHPVTNEQFVRFLTVMGGEKDAYHRDLIRLRDSRLKRSGGKLSIESGYHRHPVVGVTWYGAAAYSKWVGRRLPTEAEWEIAASGAGAEWPYPTGENVDKALANYFSADTTPAGSHPPNALGLYDIAGNVYEWCYDWYDYNYYEKAMQEPDNPEGPVQGVYRVLRGGCWKSLKEDLRCSRRHRNNPGTVNGTYGFRCASDVDPVS